MSDPPEEEHISWERNTRDWTGASVKDLRRILKAASGMSHSFAATQLRILGFEKSSKNCEKSLPPALEPKARNVVGAESTSKNEQ